VYETLRARLYSFVVYCKPKGLPYNLCILHNFYNHYTVEQGLFRRRQNWLWHIALHK